MDKCKSPKDYLEKIEVGDFERMKTEFFSRRRNVGLRFDLDDIDEQILTDEQKKERVETFKNLGGEDFMLAELYGLYSNVSSTFGYKDKRIELSGEEVYDNIHIFYDE